MNMFKARDENAFLNSFKKGPQSIYKSKGATGSQEGPRMSSRIPSYQEQNRVQIQIDNQDDLEDEEQLKMQDSLGEEEIKNITPNITEQSTKVPAADGEANPLAEDMQGKMHMLKLGSRGTSK